MPLPIPGAELSASTTLLSQRLAWRPEVRRKYGARNDVGRKITSLKVLPSLRVNVQLDPMCFLTGIDFHLRVFKDGLLSLNDLLFGCAKNVSELHLFAPLGLLFERK